MLYYYKFDIDRQIDRQIDSEGIYIDKTSGSIECNIGTF